VLTIVALIYSAFAFPVTRVVTRVERRILTKLSV
jgi:hypothetical protein